MRFALPDTATAPFCPAEIAGSVAVPPAGRLATMLRFAGPGLLVAVGYMDPGNWATDIAAGARHGYGLLFVVAGACLAAMVLQTLAARLGIAAGRDLAEVGRDRYPRPVRLTLWLLAELAIIATDIAEVLGSALAIKLLFGLPLWLGILLTAFDTVLVLGLKGQGFRQIEAIVLGLVTTIVLCFAVQLAIVAPDGAGIARGLAPDLARLAEPGALTIAIGIIGATVMPHNLYLHSAVVQTRDPGPGPVARQRAIRFATIDIIGALLLASLVNGAILVLAAASFHAAGMTGVTDIDQAWRLLEPLTGGPAAALLFAIALLASGQSATFTGTIAGQVILEGFLNLSIPCWQRRLITRALALLPALAGAWWLGDGGVGRLLVLTQVVLSLQLPFALWPLIRATSDRGVMGAHASPAWLAMLAWGIFGVIVAANGWLLVDLFGG